MFYTENNNRWPKNPPDPAFVKNDGDDDRYKDLSYFEFMDKAKFVEFLYDRQKPYGGILQKFIEPNTDRNHVLQMTWSPKICLFERRLNN